MPGQAVHEEAERLEHAISERFEERIPAMLGDPKFDPHGHCISAMNGKMPTQDSVSLAEVREGGQFVALSISDLDAPLLKQLKANGIAMPAERITHAAEDLHGCQADEMPFFVDAGDTNCLCFFAGLTTYTCEVG